MAESTLRFCGVLQGHRGWVTSISCTIDAPNVVISSSRDKKVILWNITPDNPEQYGYAKRALSGHSQPVQDVVLSTDGQFALSGSWDKTLRLWDLNKGESVRSFVGHTGDIFSVAFSVDNRQIVSGSRDKTIKLWNTLAECKYTILDDQHTDWISCVRFSPSAKQPIIVSCGWDKLVKVWSLTNCKLKTNLAGHSGPLYTVTISPDGSLCASGGKDGTAMLWDVNEGKHLYSLEAGVTINALCFSPKNYWLCAATDNSIKIWDLENKNVLEELHPTEPSKSGLPWCVSLTWSADGNTLFAGSTDTNIYVYEIARQTY
ncbi:unnamed protein product [Vitrella brassicaformis CCMP3155]|uniref:Uncharacterized protein n=2 Tax=Vitrella brassicaformis TaxID=1169539 RepID=A0A0G4F3F3_VITBC|nr:unnamed protein product [Vitrella brassicaformis CCMP3155]|eukprot:CEM06724.1 unnamed protein product [Vitrella brassicaformis CCMP3155]